MSGADYQDAAVGSLCWPAERDAAADEQDEFSFSSLLLLSPSSSWSLSSSSLSSSPPLCLSLPLSPRAQCEEADCCHTAELRTDSPAPDCSLSGLSTGGDDGSGGSDCGVASTDSDSPQLLSSPRAAHPHPHPLQHPLSSASFKASGGRKRRLPAASCSASPCPSPSPSARCCSELLGDAEKRERNKQSASDYRKRRKLFVSSLEKQLQQAEARLSEAQQEARRLAAENSSLRQTISAMKQRKTASTDTAAERGGDLSLLSSSSGGTHSSAALCPRIPPQFRPTPPSLSAAAAEGGCAAAVGPVRRSSRRAAGAEAAGGADSLRLGSLCMFVLFSFFLLYLPFVTQHDGSSPQAVSQQHAAAFSAFPQSDAQRPPDCSLLSSPLLCHRGRTILALDAEAEGGELREEQWAETQPSLQPAGDEWRPAVNESARDAWLPPLPTATAL